MLVRLFLLVMAFDFFLLRWLLAYRNTFTVVFVFHCFFLLTFAMLLYVFCWILLVVILFCFLILFFGNYLSLILLLIIGLDGMYLLNGRGPFQILEDFLFFLGVCLKTHLWKHLDLMAHRVLIIHCVFDKVIHIFILNLLYHLEVKEFHLFFSLIIILFFVIHLVKLYYLKKNLKFLNLKNFVDFKKMT